MHVTGNCEGPIDLKECPVYSVLGEELHPEKYVIRVELSSLDEVTFQIEQTLRLEDRSAWTLEGHANSLLFEMNVGKYNQTDIGKECPSCDGMKNYWHSLKDRPNFTEQPLLLRWDWCQNTWRMSFIGSGISDQEPFFHPVKVETGLFSLDHQWMNEHRIKDCYKICDEEHAGTCHTILDSYLLFEPLTELYLIDVQRSCLVSRSGNSKYAALSYVWGKEKKPFQTTEENLNDLLQEGSFQRCGDVIPKTIRDCIGLVANLGLRYLWVDRFCIIQNHEVHKQHQIDNMASIYANSYFTVIAANGDDDSYGLRGLRASEVERDLPWMFFPGNKREAFIWDKYIAFPDNGGSRYKERGWTFQEYELSPRKLLFTQRTLFWICKDSVYPEPKIIGEEFPGDSKFHEMSRAVGQGLNLDSLPVREPLRSLHSYSLAVERFSSRELRYPEDTQRAFTAILSAASRSLGRLHFGIPERLFNECLLWEPKILVEKTIRRRKDSKGNILDRFPSWSWLGWEGQVDTEYWQNRFDHSRMWIKSESIIKWYKLIDDLKTRIQIGSTPCTTKDERNEDWIQNDEYDLEHPPPLQTTTTAYQIPWSPTISLRASRAFVRVVGSDGSLTASSFGRYWHRSEFLVDASGSIVGTVRLTSGDFVPFGQTCELIGISKGMMHLGHALLDYTFLEYFFFNRENMKAIEDYDNIDESVPIQHRFYNVLWIEWKGDIAYRRGTGRVFADHWESIATEEIDVLLG
ncbi:HET-domain-containing protein [Corynespora cassiicola Philippines]|uniref:HET-domain-containing protein n=1 Tax=Corynespora cassiicola Philippines TaxID=1448308 RepID=A0A2T2NFZ8_CORCC|nr:HET-domain-containing protein [Corynespora cassiicola Philippines]